MSMEFVIPIIVAVITGLFGICSAFIAARRATDNVIKEMEVKQAVQNERVDNYQRVTNEKIDNLTNQLNAQSAYGTRIAILENWRQEIDRERRNIQ